jgi:hypothetical protein
MTTHQKKRSKRDAVLFSPLKEFENTTVFLFTRREVKAGAVAVTADVIFFSTNRAKPQKKGTPHFL